MCDNEYLAESMVKERLREAEARGALSSMLRRASSSPQPAGVDGGSERPQPKRLEIWWQTSAAWVAQLTLPKMWNRL